MAAWLQVKPFPMLHQLWHTGRNVDLASGARTLLEIKRRGSWKADASLRRYEKSGRIAEQLHALAPAVSGFCVKAHQLLPEMLLGQCGALPCPGR